MFRYPKPGQNGYGTYGQPTQWKDTDNPANHAAADATARAQAGRPGRLDKVRFNTTSRTVKGTNGQPDRTLYTADHKLGFRIATNIAGRLLLPIALGVGTDFALHHSLDLSNDAAFSALYAAGINGGERLLAMLGSSQRESTRRGRQRNDSIVGDATRRAVAQRNKRDNAIFSAGETKGAQDAKVGSRLSAARDALTGNGKTPSK